MFDFMNAGTRIGGYLVLPESQHDPTRSFQFLIDLLIPISIPFNLIEPIFAVAFECSPGLFVPLIAVPELTIAENGHSGAHQDKIWFAEDRILLSISETSLPECFSKLPFYSRPARSDSRHRISHLFARRIHCRLSTNRFSGFLVWRLRWYFLINLAESLLSESL